MKTVGTIAVTWKVHAIGVVIMDGVVGKNGLEMDVTAPLAGQPNIYVYWNQVKNVFPILEHKNCKGKKQRKNLT